MRTIDARTRVCALIGDPVEHSFSPLIHNAGFEALGLNFVYVAFRVKEIGPAIEGIRALNLRGVSVTIPHKIKALVRMDSLDPLAAAIGSINTIVNDQGKLTGYNSDGLGALRALQEGAVNLKGKSVLVLGSGGAARAVSFALATQVELAGLTILGVLPDELQTLVRDLQNASSLQVDGKLRSDQDLKREILAADLLINCTPIGMYPQVDATPVPVTLLRKDLTVFDIVYNPPRTRLLQLAQDQGAKTISGIEMFLNQAMVQFELWTGKGAPEAIMRKTLLSHVNG